MRQQVDAAVVWKLAELQHGAVSRSQLLVLGYTPAAIEHRLDRGRLHRKAWGVYAVGRPDLSRYGEFMVALLGAGPGAVLSHESAAELWEIRRREAGPIEVSLPRTHRRPRAGVLLHRRRVLGSAHVMRVHGVPATSPALTLIDIANVVSTRHLEAAVNQTDALDLLDPPALRRLIRAFPHQPGVVKVRRLLDDQTFRLTDSELERMFLRLVRCAGLDTPSTQRYANTWRVDFMWHKLGLVVETDSLRYHRTPGQQTRDYARDHAHRLAGLTPLRFTHSQIARQPEQVIQLLNAEVRRLGSR